MENKIVLESEAEIKRINNTYRNQTYKFRSSRYEEGLKIRNALTENENNKFDLLVNEKINGAKMLLELEITYVETKKSESDLIGKIEFEYKKEAFVYRRNGRINGYSYIEKKNSRRNLGLNNFSSIGELKMVMRELEKLLLIIQTGKHYEERFGFFV